MNWLPLRIRLLIFRNKYTAILTILLMVGGILLIKYLVFFAYNQYARATFMKPFYDKVALADRYNSELPLDHFVSRATTHSQETSGNGGQGWVENCTVPGTYFDYQANTQSNNVRFCSYGYISYYWEDALDSATIDHIAQQMQAAGWTLNDDAESQETNKERVNTTLLGGYTFSRPDGIQAYTAFLNKPLEMQNSGSFSAYPYWDFLSHAHDPHNFFVAVDVSYSVRMRGNQLLDN